MNSLFLLFVLACSFAPARGITGSESISPCPNVLTYIINETTPTYWTAQVSLKSDTDIRGVWLIVVFDNPPGNVTVSRWILFGHVNTYLNSQIHNTPLQAANRKTHFITSNIA